MSLPTIKQLVSYDGGGHVLFVECRDGALWYRVHYLSEEFFERCAFDFPIPLEDTAGAVFPASDEKRIYYMRWMRKHLKTLAGGE